MSKRSFDIHGFGNKFLQNKEVGNPQPATTLTLTGLSSHAAIDLNFYLAIIDSWDGTSGNDFGPDYFNVTLTLLALA